MAAQTRRNGAIAYVKVESAIGLLQCERLRDAVDWVDAQADLERVVLSVVEGDLEAVTHARADDDAPQDPRLAELLERIEASEVPWIAVITGDVQGIGCEIALACRMRFAHPHALIGLPEVKLGLIPGAGGTQRLPRLIGFGPALEMIATGEAIDAAQARKLRLIDDVLDEPALAAETLDIGLLTHATPLYDLPAPVLDAEALERVRGAIEQKSPNEIAPQRAIELVVLSTRSTIAEGMEVERCALLELRTGAQARALRHFLSAQRDACQAASLGATSELLEYVVVLGRGAAGVDITLALLNAGLQVTLLDTDADALARASEALERNFIANLATRDDMRRRFRARTDYAQAADATLVIEAMSEDTDVKVSVFRMLETCLPRAVLATHSSCHQVSALAQAVSDPARVIGLHFCMSIPTRRLLEIACANNTGYCALATGFALARRLGKTPVRAGVSDSLISSRLLARYYEAADTVFMDGSTPWEVDEAMVAFGYDMGPFEAEDVSGLDLSHRQRTPDRRSVPLIDRMLELGKLGRKTGAGWYRYPGGKGKVEDPIVADLALEESHFERRTRTDYTGTEIQERLLLALINEAADLLHEGIATNARDIDLVSVLGCGFPRWRGGLMHYADTLGAQHIVNRLDVLAQEDPLVWAASPLLRHSAQAGEQIAR